MKKLIAYVLLAIVVIGAGCIGPLSEELTPGRCDPDVVAYNEEAGTGNAEDYKGLFFPSLASLKLLQADFNAAVAVTEQELIHLAEQKQLQAKILRGIVVGDIEIAIAREEFIFNPTTGALAIGLSILGVGAGGYLGLIRKRPQDITPVEMEKALGEVKGEVTNRDRKFIQLVNGMKIILDAQPETVQKEMKNILKNSQSPETRVAVKEALAKL